MLSSARVSFFLAALILRTSVLAAGPLSYTGAPASKAVYSLTVTGNALVGRTRKPFAMYKNVEYRVQGLVREEVRESSPKNGLLLRLGYENQSLTAKLGGIETGLFEYLAGPFLPRKDDAIDIRVGPRGGVTEALPSAMGYSARISAAFLEACLRPPLPPAGLKAGAVWKARVPTMAGAVAEFEGLFMNLNLKAVPASGGWWEIEEDAGVLRVLVQDSEEGTPAEFRAQGRVRLGPGLSPRWGKFSTELRRKGPESAPPEKCDILVEVK